jgi:hypothetical protein
MFMYYNSSTHAYMHVYIYLHTYTHALAGQNHVTTTRAYMHVYIHLHTHLNAGRTMTQRNGKDVCLRRSAEGIYVYVYAGMCVCIYI